MTDIFSDANRRDPYPLYDAMRSGSPVLQVPPPFNAWLVFDYDGVKRVLSDYDTFSSQVPAPKNWFIFFDPPRHTKLRGLISKAFTPRMIVTLEQRIRQLSAQLLDQAVGHGEMDLADDYATPLPMMVISEMIGIPAADWPTFTRWSDAILKLSLSRSGEVGAAEAMSAFGTATAEMTAYLADMIAQRRALPQDDLLTRLIEAEVDGEHLDPVDILGFFQLLIVGGQETTTNLINNALVCLFDNPDQLAHLKARPELIPSAIEEVLRYRSPLQWMMRTPKHDVELHGRLIPTGALVLAMIGSANRDPKQFRDPARFDITRDPNPHIAFGHGIHSCLGAALARLEGRIALSDLLARLKDLRPASTEPWEPRKALHVHGPIHLPVRFQPSNHC